MKRLFYIFVTADLLLTTATAQETNSTATGKVYLDNREAIEAVTVTLVHEPTQNKYVTATQGNGYFHFFNLKPGGPYTITFTSVGFEILKIDNLSARLTGNALFAGDTELSEFSLKRSMQTLKEVHITGSAEQGGSVRNINRSHLNQMPSINRSFEEYVRIVPQANVNREGVISLAGQNNRFNSFFIDGAINNDISGLAVSGMNGGQTGSPPVSVEALQEINVLLAPYDVQYSNFTGGSINAITRSGSNDNRSSAWYYFRNENLAGRSPQAIERADAPGKFHRPRLSEFFNHTFGAWNSGAIVKDKLFYFVLYERQSELRPQPYDFGIYRGKSNRQQLDGLKDFLQKNYGFDPGSYMESKDELNATRVNIKIDWNASLKDKFTVSYRYNDASRIFQPRPSGSTSIVFSNSGARIPSTTHAASLEWRRYLNKNTSNRLLVSFTRQKDDRESLGQVFPTVLINDGGPAFTITFGSEANTGLYRFNAKQVSLLDVFKWVKNNHVFSAGADLEYTHHDRSFITSYIGSYQFRQLDDFLSNSYPSRLVRGYSLSDATHNDSKFQLFRGGIFLNDELRPSSRLRLNFGVRFDINAILSSPQEDKFFNDTALAIISKHYDMSGAMSGKTMKRNGTLSPRIGAEYRIKKYNVTLKGGAGIFAGRTINLWIFDTFNSNTGSIDINPQEYNLRFNGDPYSQPNAQTLNLDPGSHKGTLNLIARKFKYPAVFRSTITAQKKLKYGWSISVEGLLTMNISEAQFKNVNITPPYQHSVPPDVRNVYSTNSAPPKIQLRPTGIENPYAGIFLLRNNNGRKGQSYSGSVVVEKHSETFAFTGSYTYGRSQLLNEVTGAQTPIASQWRNVETIDGRNYAGISTSDNEIKHRISGWFSKKFTYGRRKTSTTISLFYNGQSGSPFSYVYNGSIINDENSRQSFDLIYIPTANELEEMSFVPIKDNSGQDVYTADQQKQSLNAFIENDKYLKRHRGEFAERNGARVPFIHLLDLKFMQQFSVRMNKRIVGLLLTYDVFNFTNMINRKWGRTWFLSNDAYPLITFAGWAQTSPLVPQYQFQPLTGAPYIVQTSSLPGISARWISQLGVKITVD